MPYLSASAVVIPYNEALYQVYTGLSVLNLGPMYATDVRRTSSLNAPYPRGGA